MSERGILLSIVNNELDREVICLATEKVFLGKLSGGCSGESLSSLSKFLISELTKHYLESALDKLNSCYPTELCIERFTITALVESTAEDHEVLHNHKNNLENTDGDDYDEEVTANSDAYQSDDGGDCEVNDVIAVTADQDRQCSSVALLLPRDGGEDSAVSSEDKTDTAYPNNLENTDGDFDKEVAANSDGDQSDQSDDGEDDEADDDVIAVTTAPDHRCSSEALLLPRDGEDDSALSSEIGTDTAYPVKLVANQGNYAKEVDSSDSDHTGIEEWTGNTSLTDKTASGSAGELSGAVRKCFSDILTDDEPGQESCATRKVYRKEVKNHSSIGMYLSSDSFENTEQHGAYRIVMNLEANGDDDELVIVKTDAEDQCGSEALLPPRSRNDKDDSLVSSEEETDTAYPVNLVANQGKYATEVDSSDNNHTRIEEWTGNTCLTDKTASGSAGELSEAVGECFNDISTDGEPGQDICATRKVYSGEVNSHGSCDMYLNSESFDSSEQNGADGIVVNLEGNEDDDELVIVKTGPDNQCGSEALLPSRPRDNKDDSVVSSDEGTLTAYPVNLLANPGNYATEVDVCGSDLTEIKEWTGNTSLTDKTTSGSADKIYATEVDFSDSDVTEIKEWTGNTSLTDNTTSGSADKICGVVTECSSDISPDREHGQESCTTRKVYSREVKSHSSCDMYLSSESFDSSEQNGADGVILNLEANRDNLALGGNFDPVIVNKKSTTVQSVSDAIVIDIEDNETISKNHFGRKEPSHKFIDNGSCLIGNDFNRVIRNTSVVAERQDSLQSTAVTAEMCFAGLETISSETCVNNEAGDPMKEDRCYLMEKDDCEEVSERCCSENSATVETSEKFVQGVPTDVFPKRGVRSPKMPQGDLSVEDRLYRMRHDHMSYTRSCKTSPRKGKPCIPTKSKTTPRKGKPSIPTKSKTTPRKGKPSIPTKSKATPRKGKPSIPSKKTEFKGLLKCYPCGKNHRKRSTLLRHIKKEHMQAKPVMCEVCNKEMKTPAAFHEHQVKHSKVNLYDCQVCKKRFKTSKILNNHKKTHNPLYSYTCLTCGLVFPNISKMEKHKSTHSDCTTYDVKKIPLECNICGRTSEEGILNIHINRRKGGKQYRCHVCTKAVKPYRCKQCDRTFSWPSHLKTHEHLHTGEKPYSCLICGKSFALECVWRGHVRTHSSEKPHACEICGKSFRLPRLLKEHRVIHSGEKPFVCRTCGKAYAVQKSLYGHYKYKHRGVTSGVPTDQGPLAQSDCKLQSVSKLESVVSNVEVVRCRGNYLDCKRTTVLRMRPLQPKKRDLTLSKEHICSYCGMAFRLLRNLREHETIHSGERPHMCDQCGETFRLPRGLVLHQQKHQQHKP